MEEKGKRPRDSMSINGAIILRDNKTLKKIRYDSNTNSIGRCYRMKHNIFVGVFLMCWYTDYNVPCASEIVSVFCNKAHIYFICFVAMFYIAGYKLLFCVRYWNNNRICAPIPIVFYYNFRIHRDTEVKEGDKFIILILLRFRSSLLSFFVNSDAYLSITYLISILGTYLIY